jgi:hypothetical protein
MTGFKYEGVLFKSIVDAFVEEYGDDISSIGLSEGNVAGVKQLDVDFIPVDIDSGLFSVIDGKISLNIGALKNAIENYVEPVEES